METVTLYRGILLMLLLLTFLPLFSVGYISYERSVALLENKITESNIRTLEQVQKRLDSFFTEVDTASSMISNHKMFQSMLTDMHVDDYEMYKATREFLSFTLLLTAENPDIYSITLYGNDLRRIDSFGRFLPEGGNRNYTKVFTALKQTGPVLYPPEVTEDGKWVIPYARQVIDQRNGRVIGVLLVESYLSDLWKYLSQVRLIQTGYVIVADHGGRIIYHPDQTPGRQFIPEWQESKTEKHFFVVRENGAEELVIPMESRVTGWKLYGVIPYKEIIGQVDDVRNMVFLSAFVLLAAITAVAWLLRIYLVKPIRKLQSLMRQVEQGNLQVQATFWRKDEIGALGRSFNRMVRQIEQLIEDVKVAKWNEAEAKYLQKQAQYAALQARIAPHFLYNTLDGISWKAQDYGIREISAVIDDLAGMLRYSLEHSESQSTLEQEFAHAGMYAEIMEFRAGGLTEFRFDLPETLRKVPVPRFTIQPLVENSVQHGLEPMPEGGTVSVRAYEQDGFVIVEVADSGTGITEEELESLRQRLELGPESFATGAKGNGLHNVHQRIRLAFGEQYGLRLNKGEPGGLVVHVYLPGNDMSKS